MKGTLATLKDCKRKTPVASTSASGELLHPTVNWGQNYPFNQLTPEIEGVKAPVGCVATAMAIAMQYHNWPDYTRGGIAKDFYFPDETFDFSNYTIDWAALNDSTSANFKSEVAKLSYSAGVSVSMIYGNLESAAEDWVVGNELREHYVYDKECQFVPRDKFADEDWNQLLRDQLEEVGPVIYRGSGTGGHTFVIDGYDSEGFYHVNWGWDGMLNGYFALDFSDIGGMDFGGDQGMVINIRPDKQRREYSKSFIPNAEVYTFGFEENFGWNFSQSQLVPGEKIDVRIPSIALNCLRGVFAVAVVDEEDNIIQVLEYYGYNDGTPVYCPYPGSDFMLSIVFPDLKPGQKFQVVSQEIPSEIDPGYIPAHEPSYDPKDWRIVPGGILCPSYFYAKGNRSDVVDFRFHIDEDLPFCNELHVSYEHEYTEKRLKGTTCSENMLAPEKGVSIEVMAYDKEGNTQEAWVASSFTDDLYFMTISAYHNSFDVYYRYTRSDDTRKDSEIPRDSIVDAGGLVYRIMEDGLSLIGYDNVPAKVTIPDYVMVDGNEFPVVSIGKSALLHAPVTELIFDARHIESMSPLAFAGMDDLKCVTLNSWNETKSFGSKLSSLFRKSRFKEVYLNTTEPDGFMSEILSHTVFDYDPIDDRWTHIIEKDDLTLYMNHLPDQPECYPYWSSLYFLDNLVKEQVMEKVVDSLVIPGIGDYDLSGLSLPVKQMWRYFIDIEKGLIKISDVMDNVSIDEVTVNGLPAHMNASGQYEFSLTRSSDGPAVSITYTLNNDRKMSIDYPAEYNEALAARITVSVETIFDTLSTEKADVFNLQGILITKDATKEQIQSLPRGLYLIGGKKVIVK